MPQGWRPVGLPQHPPAPQVSRTSVVLYDTPLPRGLNVYAIVQFVAALLLAIVLLVAAKSLVPLQQLGVAVLVLWSLVNIGGIFELRLWALVSEIMRVPVAAAALLAALPAPSAIVLVALAIAVLTTWLFLLCYYRQFTTRPSTRSDHVPKSETPDKVVNILMRG